LLNELYGYQNARCNNKNYISFISLVKVKGKAVCVTGLDRPKGSRGIRIPDFKLIGTWSW